MSNLTALLITYGLTNDSFPIEQDGRIWKWYSAPNIRGKSDILWICLTTTFLCTYSLLSLNIPSPKDTDFQIFRRRLQWMLTAIMGPEIVLSYAAGQWSRARHSRKAFHNSGYKQWSMRMAFFADMGGFVLKAKDSASFPLNAAQLHWLVVNGHVSYPSVSDEEIGDKSKQDLLSKVVASLQAGYLLVSCIGRAAQGLSITTLELNALAIVVCSLMTVVAWYNKPCDVRTAIVLHAEASAEEISSGRLWRTTPLDFVDANEPGYSMNVQPFMRMPVIPADRPIMRIPNDRFPTDPYGVQEYCVCLATLLFTGIHLVGWNFSFPSPLEQILWRVSSSILFGVTAVFWVLETAASWVRLGRWRRILRLVSGRSQQQLDDVDEEVVGTKDIEERTQLPLPWEFWTIMPIAVVYGLARTYLLVEAVYGLRSLEMTALITPQWSLALPHI